MEPGAGTPYAFVAWLQDWAREEFGDSRTGGSTANRWVEIQTLEPGWAVTVSLTGTSLQEAGIRASEADDVEIIRGEHNWVDGGTQGRDLEWQGRGGATNLPEILSLFRQWAEAEGAD
jgi:hypothetical protein